MKIIKNIDEIPELKNAVITVGSFDGVHIGHKAIIRKTIDAARSINGNSVAVTFSPHPQEVLFPERKNFYILNTKEEKSALLSELGIDYLVIIHFTKEFAALSSEQFIKEYITGKLKANTLIIGYDHHFGNQREGTIMQLTELGKKYHFNVEEVPAQYINGTAVSSTKIRNAIAGGNMLLANSFLGYSYFMKGQVVRGRGLGRKLDFPTANIEAGEKNKLLPGDGAYAVALTIDGAAFNGMMNIGLRPTVDGSERVAEVNIFDFSSDIYGEKIKIHFIEKIRDEKKFNGINELRQQLFADREHALKILLRKPS